MPEIRATFCQCEPKLQEFIELHWPESHKLVVTKEDEILSGSQNTDLFFYGDGRDLSLMESFPHIPRVFLSCENRYPDFSMWDHIFSHPHINHDRYFQLPYWMQIHPLSRLEGNGWAELKAPEDFCAMVVSNSNQIRTFMRIEFFKKLTAVKTVNSGGRMFNNIGGPVDDRRAFMSKHRFTICFENASFPGYTTEKIVDAKVSGSVPIYWGDPLINDVFNPKCFINVSDYGTIDRAIEAVMDLENNPSKYEEKLREPLFVDGICPEAYQPERVRNFIEKMLKNPSTPRIGKKTNYLLHELKKKVIPYYFYSRYRLNGKIP